MNISGDLMCGRCVFRRYNANIKTDLGTGYQSVRRSAETDYIIHRKHITDAPLTRTIDRCGSSRRRGKEHASDCVESYNHDPVREDKKQMNHHKAGYGILERFFAYL